MNTAVSRATGFLYRNFLKKICFLLDAEFVHNTIVKVGVVVGKHEFLRQVPEKFWAYQDPALNRRFNKIRFPNPVGLAAGFDYNGDLTLVLPAVGFGFHTIGTVTHQPYEGNSRPRLGRFPRSQALLVNKGLKNSGAKKIIEKLEKLQFHIPTGISIASTNKQYCDYKEQITDIMKCFKEFEESQVAHAYYELNISCPNTFGGEPFTSKKRLDALLTQLDKLKISRPIFVKMPIDQSLEESEEMLHVMAKHNVQGVVVGNLTKDRSNPAVNEKDRAEWQKRKGNLSGKPTWERSNALIALTRKKFKKRFTIIGLGGVFSAQDAQKKIELGADLVQLITGMIYQGPQLVGQINAALAKKSKTV